MHTHTPTHTAHEIYPSWVEYELKYALQVELDNSFLFLTQKAIIDTNKSCTKASPPPPTLERTCTVCIIGIHTSLIDKLMWVNLGDRNKSLVGRIGGAIHKLD